MQTAGWWRRERWAEAGQGLADIGLFKGNKKPRKGVQRGSDGPAYCFKKITGGCVVGNGRWRDRAGSWEPRQETRRL